MANITTCPKCQGSGALSKDSDFLDCTYCGSAEGRAALEKWIRLHCQHMTREQRDWAIFQHAMQMAAYRERDE